MQVFIIMCSLFFGFGRAFIPGHSLSWAGTYEAMAHIWVGVLFTLWLYNKNKLAGVLLLVITIIEIVFGVFAQL